MCIFPRVCVTRTLEIVADEWALYIVMWLTDMSWMYVPFLHLVLGQDSDMSDRKGKFTWAVSCSKSKRPDVKSVIKGIRSKQFALSSD